ncbi:HAD family hydrolase [Psychrobacter pygoscelis]|uniref:HAD family hydrolase n=1 Tax=Psychrobacter pygoscelis TaxID=2488563 RepID=UPI00103E853C|nr:HAD-IIB family hydrolase [Psychrobacter pygoscelis]
MPHSFTPKIIFFDIDDTLSRGGIIAPHNQATLQGLAHTEIKLVIATGRAKPMLPKDILDLHDKGIIDAVICMNGQYSFYKDGSNSDKVSRSSSGDKSKIVGNEALIKHYPLTLPQVEQIVQICQQEQVVYKLDSTHYIAWSAMHEHIKELMVKNSYFIVDPDFHKCNDVYQCSVIFNNEKDKMQHIDFAKFGLKLVHWHNTGADIIPIDASKARAVLDVCRHYDIDVKDAMAFGDGLNDLEMFDLVGCSVAMGDGQPALIERADLVTGSIEERGIQAVLDKFYVV